MSDSEFNIMLWGPAGWDDKLKAEWKAAVLFQRPTMLVVFSGARVPDDLESHPLVKKIIQIPNMSEKSGKILQDAMSDFIKGRYDDNK